MIQGYCRTNLDDYSCDVRVFVAIPRIGDYVACIYKGNQSDLKVCRVTHEIRNDNTPFIIVELTK